MQATIIDRYSHLTDTAEGVEAIAAYIAAVEGGACHAEAETIGCNVLQRAGYNVNATGGASFSVASIDHNDVPGARVYLVIDRDDRGYFVATRDDEDTGPRFFTVDEAYASIGARWGQDAWHLALA